MQKIKGILKVASGVCTWCDERGNNDNPPSFPLGANIALEIDLRQAATSGITDILPAYPIAELAADSYSIALDGDYDHLTDPKMLLTSGIVISEGALLEDGTARTIITATIPNTNYAGLKAAVLVAESLSMEGEIAGHLADSVSSFVFAFPLLVRNRVWYPDDAPDSVVNDPDYLNTMQVEAKIAADVATAVAAATATLNGEDGTSNFVYIAYASDNAGADFDLTPSASLPYMAMITSETELTPPVVGNFSAATWVRYIGTDGTPGTVTLAGLNLSPEGDWVIDVVYAEDDAVRHNNAVWQSLADDNVGNEPSAESEYWQLWVQDGADGDDGVSPIYGYNTVSDPASLLWHTNLAADDVYFRVSLDDGITWSVAHELSKAQAVIAQYNPDATSDWQTATKPSGAAYSTATGKYFRVSFTGGLYGDAAAIMAGMTSQELRIQFSATGIIENAVDWHAEPAAGDMYIRFYNLAGTVQVKFTVDTGGLEIVSVELSPTQDPWHTVFVTGDKFMRVSVDGGGTYSTPIKVVGDDAAEPETEFSVNGVDWTDSPTNAIYQRWSTDGGATWTAAIQIKGADGAGIEIGAIGLLADRGDYDAAAVGFVYLATDEETDDDGRPYNLLYIRSTSTQGTWSDGAIAYIGPQGETGPASTVPGPRGADATIIADLEFASTDLVEDIEHGGALTIPGVKAIAQVEVYDANGDGISIERGDAAENGACMIKTKYTANETIVYFGTIDVANGGRIKFAQGTEANSILLGSNTDFFMDVLKLRLRRPYITSNLHLVVQGSVSADFSGYATIIDTENVEADRAIVEGYDPGAEEFVACPETGFSADFVGQSILAGMSGLGSPRYIRYKWVYATGDTGWYTTFFPSSGESFASEIPVDTVGALLKVSTVNAEGTWSIDGETFYSNGESINLAAGSYTIQFTAVEGYLTPGSINLTLASGESKHIYGNYLAAAGGAGTLTVNISGPDSARWSIDGANWYADGVTIDLLAGDYVVQFLAVDQYITPDAIPNTIADTDTDTVNATYYADQSPAAYGMTWVNGAEPTITAPAIKRYITPTGAGLKDGSNWANAYAGIYRASLDMGPGDALYLWEGEYSLLAPLSMTAEIAMYGGFNGDGTWATRDAFAHQSIINGSSFGLFNNTGPYIIDGLTLQGFNSCVTGNDFGTKSYEIEIQNCAFINCSYNSYTIGLIQGVKYDCKNNLFMDCTTPAFAYDDEFTPAIEFKDCVFANTKGGFVYSPVTDCEFFGGEISSFAGAITGSEFTGVVIMSGTGTAYTGCTMSNCEIDDAGATATACKFINCKVLPGGGYALRFRICTTAVNCLFENCTAITTLAISATYCTAIRCNRLIAEVVKNCAAWGTSAVGITKTTCAQSAYIDESTVVLGDDNALAEFTSLGNVTAIGAQTPSPDATDWGDYHIGATSVLKGAGTHDSEITTDITGAARANPPSIGCYE